GVPEKDLSYVRDTWVADVVDDPSQDVIQVQAILYKVESPAPGPRWRLIDWTQPDLRAWHGDPRRALDGGCRLDPARDRALGCQQSVSLGHTESRSQRLGGILARPREG